MIQDLNILAVVERSLELEGRTFTVVDVPGWPFACSLQPPRVSREDDGSPRDRDHYIMRFRKPPFGPGTAKAGCRVSLESPLLWGRPYENVTHELVSDPREVRVGPLGTVMQAECLPVGELYPYEGTLKEQNGTEVGSIVVALWSDREGHQDTGTYEEFRGEAPVEFADELGNNRWIDLDGERYRITASILDLEGPRVKFDARRANA